MITKQFTAVFALGDEITMFGVRTTNRTDVEPMARKRLNKDEYVGELVAIIEDPGVDQERYPDV